MAPAEAYLDIETTGLQPRRNRITVIGIHLCNGDQTSLVQLVGKDATAENTLEALQGVQTIYTYNGSRFDMPFIYARLGINLCTEFQHFDLMFNCWQNKLFGGLKRVEQKLGIDRELKDVNGLEAIRLWYQYLKYGDLDALHTLLRYNAEDVVNLRTLRDKLLTYQCPID